MSRTRRQVSHRPPKVELEREARKARSRIKHDAQDALDRMEQDAEDRRFRAYWMEQGELDEYSDAHSDAAEDKRWEEA